VSQNGRRPLGRTDLSVAAMRSLVRQLLPEEERDALARVGATRYELPTLPDLPDEHFTIYADLAQGDPLVEVRRSPVPDEDYVSPEIFPRAVATRSIAVGDDNPVGAVA
jgi:hypothetical protein